jgi:hypothetical protein
MGSGSHVFLNAQNITLLFYAVLDPELLLLLPILDTYLKLDHSSHHRNELGQCRHGAQRTNPEVEARRFGRLHCEVATARV